LRIRELIKILKRNATRARQMPCGCGAGDKLLNCRRSITSLPG
jgi:hypothetical protein